MIDCSNAEMRDRLPDLANESLSPEARAVVVAHIEGCAPCADEIEIIRVTRVVLRDATPGVDVDRIVNALPSARQPRTVSIGQRWGGGWRIAAAITLFAVGAGSYAIVRPGDAVPSAADSIFASSDSTGLALTGALADLTEGELASLADGINEIQALPSTDVEMLSVGLSGAQLELPDTTIRDLEGL